MEILSSRDIFKTFSSAEAGSAWAYLRFVALRSEFPAYGYKRLARILNVKPARTRCWKQWHGKPCAIKTAERLAGRGLLPFDSSHPRAMLVLRILGTTFGDGGIDKNLNMLHFNSSVPENIAAWRKDLFELFPGIEGTISVIETGQYGHSSCVRTTDRTVVRFFAALGAPVGNKTSIDYRLPAWLADVPSELGVGFLDGLMSCEVSVPQLRVRGSKSAHFANFALSLSKCEHLEEKHEQFLQDVRALLNSIHITTTSIRKDVHLKNKRKDGCITYSYRMLFSTSLENIAAFFKVIPLSYALDKRKKFLAEINRLRQTYRLSEFTSLVAQDNPQATDL